MIRRLGFLNISSVRTIVLGTMHTSTIMIISDLTVSITCSGIVRRRSLSIALLLV